MPKVPSIKKQADKFLDFSKESIPYASEIAREGLCQYISECPRHVVVNKTSDIYQPALHCSDCIGTIPQAELKLIEPELTRKNIVKTLRIWEVLIK